MSDIFSQTKRSDIMSKISNKDTKPEILVRKFLFSKDSDIVLMSKHCRVNLI